MVNDEKTFDLYTNYATGESLGFSASISVYEPYVRTSDGAIIIFPGGGYGVRAAHEGPAYAQFIRSFGITAFVVDYRCAPAHFPDQLLDARTAVRFVRANAEKWNINKNKISVMGSSAGGHLCALLSTYHKEIPWEDKTQYSDEEYLPNAQILCYPVISSDYSGSYGSYRNLLGDLYEEKDKFSPEKILTPQTPKAFIWNTATDQWVDIRNAFDYAKKLTDYNIPCEVHMFSSGLHGLGLANENELVAQWRSLLINWLKANCLI